MSTKSPVNVLAELDRRIAVEALFGPAHGYEGTQAGTEALIDVRAAVAELVEAAKGMRAVTGGGNVCTVTESLAAYHRLDAALAKFGDA